MAADAVRQFCNNGSSVWCFPALPAVQHRPGTQDHILHEVILIALEFGAFGEIIGFEDFALVDGQLVVLRAAAAGLLATALFIRTRPGFFRHPRRLDVRLAIQPF